MALLTEDEKSVILEMTKLAKKLNSQLFHRYFKPEFRVLIQEYQKVRFNVHVPSREELIVGKCNFPPELTLRTCKTEIKPCRVLSRCKNSPRFFCVYHEHFANLHGLPIWDDNMS